MTKRRSNHEGSITKRRRNGRVIGWKGGIVVGLTPEGREDRRWVSGLSADEVRQKLEEIKRAVATNTLAIASDHTVGSFMVEWLGHKKRMIRAITLESYQGVINKHCVPHIGRIKLTKLNASDLDRLYAKLLDKGLSTRVVRYTHTLIFGALRQALKWDLISRNVAEAATLPQLKTAEASIWTVPQVLVFLKKAKTHRLHALWYLTIFTGLRRAEVLGLHWKDVDFEKSEIHVRSTLVQIKGELLLGEPKTKAGRRSIAITKDTVEVLKLHLERQKLEQAYASDGWQGSGFVFTSEIGTPINPGNLARAYKALIRAVNLPDIRFHDLRHTAASLSIRRGDSAKVVAERLGHTNIAFTLNTYVHVFAEQRRAAAFGMADLIESDVPETGQTGETESDDKEGSS
jgi:integrase